LTNSGNIQPGRLNLALDHIATSRSIDPLIRETAILSSAQTISDIYLGQWASLQVFLNDGGVEIGNNLVDAVPAPGSLRKFETHISAKIYSLGSSHLLKMKLDNFFHPPAGLSRKNAPENCQQNCQQKSSRGVQRKFRTSLPVLMGSSPICVPKTRGESRRFRPSPRI
jgi:hypothetical protein